MDHGKWLNPVLLIGLLGLFGVGSQFVVHLYQAFYAPRDIYWTHTRSPLTLDETRDTFQVFIAGKPLDRHLAEGTLFAVADNGERYPVVARDVTARVNHWPRVQAERLTWTVFMALLVGPVLALLAAGIVVAVRAPGRR